MSFTSQVNLFNQDNLFTRVNLFNQSSPLSQVNLFSQASMHILSTLPNSRLIQCHSQINCRALIIKLSRVPPISSPLDLKAVTILMVHTDQIIASPKVLTITFNNPATPMLSSQIHMLLTQGRHIIRVHTLVIKPRTLVASNQIRLDIQYIPPMVRILLERTPGGKDILNQRGVQVLLLV